MNETLTADELCETKETKVEKLMQKVSGEGKN